LELLPSIDRAYYRVISASVNTALQRTIWDFAKPEGQLEMTQIASGQERDCITNKQVPYFWAIQKSFPNHIEIPSKIFSSKKQIDITQPPVTHPALTKLA